MTNLSTKLTYFLIVLSLLGSTLSANDLSWPTKEKIDIYHGFGEFRSNRYHAGVDIRTGGRTGRKVFSPVNGYIYRIKLSYTGYGKGLYIKGTDGRIYVFGHLKDFVKPINDLVKGIQIDKERYYIDKYFPKDSLPVKAGDLVAYSGQTGAGAPHLHFEVRATEAFPVNPLLNGFKLDDKIAPTMTRIGFQLTDEVSLFQNGTRQLYAPLKQASGKKNYIVNSPLYFSSPFGLLVDGFDRMRPGGIKQAIYRLKLTVDNNDYYEILFDTLDFETGRTVNLNYDYDEANLSRKRVRRLFTLPGNSYRRAFSDRPDNGLIQFDTPTNEISKHKAQVTAEDAFGNKARSDIEFFWGPEQLYSLDSIFEAEKKLTYFYFSPPANIKLLEIDSVVGYMNNANEWGRIKNAEIVLLDKERLRLAVHGMGAKSHTMRLHLYTAKGIISDKPFSGFGDHMYPKNTNISWEIVDGGISFRVKSMNLRGGLFYLRLFNEGIRLASLRPIELVSMQEYLFFVPAINKYARIDQIDLSLDPEREAHGSASQKVNFQLAGRSRLETKTADGQFSIVTSAKNFYRPNFIALSEKRVRNRASFDANSDLYEISPEAFLTKSDFKLSLLIDSTAVWRSKTGLCWLDEKNNKWIWLSDSELNDNRLTATSRGGGKFAAIIDRRKPKVNRISIRKGQTVKQARPIIKFTAADSLSGLSDDRSFGLYIDDRWLIPEYDPETDLCVSQPYWDLADGPHVLRVEVKDRAGNSSRTRIKFTVAAKAKK